MFGSIISNQQGAAAISLAVIVVFCLMILSGALSLLTTTGYKGYNQSAYRTQALYVAEAGLSAAVREIRDNQDYDSDGTEGGISSVTLYDGDALMIGDYAVTRSGSNPYTLTSTGTRYGTTKTITAAISGIAFFAGTKIDFKTGTINVNGHIYANDKISYGGGSVVSLDGNANATNTITGTPNSITGYSNIGVANITPLPTVDFAYWIAQAQSIGTYYAGDTVFNNDILSGIVYVDGKAEVKKNSSLTISDGCLIAKDKISAKEKSSLIITHTSPASTYYPALATEDEIKLEGGATLTGLLYAQKKISVKPKKNNSNISIVGELISWNDIKVEDKGGGNTITITHKLGDYQAFYPSATLGVSFVGGSWSEQ